MPKILSTTPMQLSATSVFVINWFRMHLCTTFKPCEAVYIVQHNVYNAGVWLRGPGTRKQIRDGSSTLELQQWSPKVACLCVNVKLFVYKLHYNALHVFVLHWIRGFELLAAKIETLVRPLVRYSHHIQCLFAPLYVFCLFWCCCWQLLFLIVLVFLIVWVVGRLEPLGRPRVRDSHQFHCPHTRWCELHKALVNHSATAMIQKWDPKGIPIYIHVLCICAFGHLTALNWALWALFFGPCFTILKAWIVLLLINAPNHPQKQGYAHLTWTILL